MKVTQWMKLGKWPSCLQSLNRNLKNGYLYKAYLKKWNYKAPKKAVKILGKVKRKFNNILDLACGTGMFAEEIKKNIKK